MATLSIEKVSYVKFKLENQCVYPVLCISFLCQYCIYYICDYPNLLLTSFPCNDLVNLLWLPRVFNLCIPIWGSSLYTLIKLVRIEFAKYGILVGNVNCLLITDNNHQLNGNEGVI
jgi:hypothetical protein